MENTIRRIIKDALPDGVNVSEADIRLERPGDLTHGDYATNIAMATAKQAGLNPMDIARRIADQINTEGHPDIDRAGAVAPGFVNIFLSGDFFARAVKRAIANPRSFGASDELRGKKIMIEHTNANLFKELHIGHLMGNAIGESLSRIIEWNGADVMRVNYQSDIGMNVAKTIWGMMRLGAEAKSISDLGRAYAKGASAYEESADAKTEIVALNKTLYAGADGKTAELYEQGRNISLAHFAKMYEILGTSYDRYFFEGEVWKEGKRIAEDALARGIFEKSDGAIVFHGEPYGLHTRVFVSSEGTATYEAKELGLTKKKWETVPDLSQSVIVSGGDQNEYFKVVIKAIELIFPEFTGKIRHIPYGLMSLKEGKMSSRKGNIVSGESLVLHVASLIAERVKDGDALQSEGEHIARDIAVGAIKYAILRQSVGRNIVFDFDTSISIEGDSGPYLQYAHARACGVLRKSAEANIVPAPTPKKQPSELERKITQFESVVSRAYREMAPNHIATYLIELSSAYNAYYALHTIVDKADPDSPDRVAQTLAFKTVMANGLYLLGIKAPERM